MVIRALEGEVDVIPREGRGPKGNSWTSAIICLFQRSTRARRQVMRTQRRSPITGSDSPRRQSGYEWSRIVKLQNLRS